jgi:CTP synthase (UTP-ammonia lyase)
MIHEINIGIIGDFDEKKISHPATMQAIKHASAYLKIKVKTNWLPTPSFLTKKVPETIEEYDAIWASSGSPYQSMDGAIAGIQRARKTGKPFIGT